MADLHPAVVVAGHKKDVGSADSPASLDFMDHYLSDFDTIRKSAADGAALRDAMLNKYQHLAVLGLLAYSAQVAFRQ